MVGNISRFVKPFQLNIVISLIYKAKSLPSKQIHFLLNLTESPGCNPLENLALASDRKYGPCHDSGILKSQYLVGCLTEIEPPYFSAMILISCNTPHVYFALTVASRVVMQKCLCTSTKGCMKCTGWLRSRGVHIAELWQCTAVEGTRPCCRGWIWERERDQLYIYLKKYI